MAAKKNRSSSKVMSKHLHVGNMHFFDEFAFCVSCEQEWELTDNGWKPVFNTCVEGYGVDTWRARKKRYGKKNGKRKA